MQNEVDDTVAVTPFVVVPAYELEQSLFALQIVLKRRETIVDRRTGVVNKVGGDQLFFRHAENVLEIRGGRFLQKSVDFLDRRIAGRSESQIDDGNVGRRDAEGHASEFALDLRQHFADGLGRAGRT